MAVNATSNDDLKAEINVTPLVDVVLVLLIIFMVVTPMLKQEVPIDLPIADSSRSAEEAEQVTLSVGLDGRAAINGADVPPGELASRLQAMYSARADKAIFLEADRDLSHGRVVEIMDDCRAAGIERIGIITKRDPNATPPVAPGSSAVVPVGVLPDAAQGSAASKE